MCTQSLNEPAFEDIKNHWAEDKITREQAMVVLTRAVHLLTKSTDMDDNEAGKMSGTFHNGKDITSWAKKGVAISERPGMVSGNKDKTLAPKDNVMLAEVATMVSRLLQQADWI